MMGDGIIFTAPGKCKWKVTDARTDEVIRSSTTVTKTASGRNSTLLRHFSVDFSKNKGNLSSKAEAKIRAEWNRDNFNNIVAIGHSWKEGTKKKMLKLSRDRVETIHDFFTDSYEELSVSTILWGWNSNVNPLFKSGAKQAKNRRVEIIEVLSGMWSW